MAFTRGGTSCIVIGPIKKGYHSFHAGAEKYYAQSKKLFKKQRFIHNKTTGSQTLIQVIDQHQ